MADFNILAPESLDTLLFTPFQQAIGEAEHQRLQKQYRNYLYYDGYQHRGTAGELVKAEDVPRPPGLDYDPTRYVSNYARLLVSKKAKWQMSGNHGVDVRVKTLGEETSPEQLAEFARAEALEAMIHRLWRENNAKARLIQAARDRLIAGRVAVKILFNPVTGKLKWVWHPDTETFPVFSDDDFENLIACHFVREKTIDGVLYYQKQTFELEDGVCFLSEGLYDAELNLVRTITPKASMELDFIPVVLVPIEDLAGEPALSKEFDDIMSLTEILTQLNEDAVDSLKFEMFGITVVSNAPGAAAKMNIAPGAVVEINGDGNGSNPDMKRVEGSFTWNEAHKAAIERVKGAMYELTSLPQSAIGDLNFGGMNNDAMRIVFHDIIQDTEEHWLTWQARLQELHEKSIRYLQARASTARVFGYDKAKLALIGDDYEHEIKFALPLPDNRADLIELLALEMSVGLESQAGALSRAGVENTAGKKAEIESEGRQRMAQTDPYGESLE